MSNLVRRSPNAAWRTVNGIPWQNLGQSAVLIVCISLCGIHVAALAVACHDKVVPTVIVLVCTHQLVFEFHKFVPPADGVGDGVGAHGCNLVA